VVNLKLRLHHFCLRYQMSDDFWCLIIGDDKTFPVTIDPAKSVGHLKDAIKKKKEHALGAFDADSLKLYQVKVNELLKKTKRMSELARLSRNLNECTELDEEDQLLKIFGEAEGKKYYILVLLPTGQSIDSRACGVVLMAGGVDVT
jgi:Crinkler effector protein N-terminal domain